MLFWHRSPQFVSQLCHCTSQSIRLVQSLSLQAKTHGESLIWGKFEPRSRWWDEKLWSSTFLDMFCLYIVMVQWSWFKNGGLEISIWSKSVEGKGETVARHCSSGCKSWHKHFSLLTFKSLQGLLAAVCLFNICATTMFESFLPTDFEGLQD